MLYSFDSQECGIATLVSEDGRICRVPVFLLPDAAKQGDLLALTPQGFLPAAEETCAAREKTQNLLNQILGK